MWEYEISTHSTRRFIRVDWQKLLMIEAIRITNELSFWLEITGDWYKTNF